VRGIKRIWIRCLLTGIICTICILSVFGQEAPVDEASGKPAVEDESAGFWDKYFQTEHKNVFVAIFFFGTCYFILLALGRRGRTLFLRTIPGVKALEEAVGRATEMGKPVLYVPGIDDIDEIQTLASLNILPYVAEMTAEYDTPLIVPTRRSVVMSVCEEIVKEAHLRTGRPDTFRPNNIRYLSDDQFAYTAAVDGIMLREKPAANIYMGGFYAESLILSETGFLAGSIQIAGTASTAQLPFFIAACDYTLIGEEFYAASAYLSQQPELLSGVKAADYLKVLILAAILIGIIAETARITGIKEFITSWF
jgi:hypothetical protein